MRRLLGLLSHVPVVKYFFEQQFYQYAIISGGISLVNIVLLWVFIDYLHIPTIVSSIVVVGGTFIVRYGLFRKTKIL